MGSHRDALAADFHRFYGRSLSSMRQWGIPLWECAAMAANLPPESATRRSLDEHWQRTTEIDLLREIEHNSRILLWQNRGGKSYEFPEPLRLPWDPPPEGSIQGDVMSQEELDKFLGWDKIKAERAAREEA